MSKCPRGQGGGVMQPSRNQYANGTQNLNFNMKLGMSFKAIRKYEEYND